MPTRNQGVCGPCGRERRIRPRYRNGHGCRHDLHGREPRADRDHAGWHTCLRREYEVLANDTLMQCAATFSDVRLSQLSSADAGISLNTSTGAVTVVAGTPVGSYALSYRMCEIVTPSNCDDATVTVATSGTYSLVYEICEIAMPSNCARATVTLDLSGR